MPGARARRASELESENLKLHQLHAQSFKMRLVQRSYLQPMHSRRRSNQRSASQSRFPDVSPTTGAPTAAETRVRRASSSSVINTNLFFLRSTNCGPSLSALSKTALNFALASATAQFAISHLRYDYSSHSDHSSHFFFRSLLAQSRITARARHFIAF